MNISLQRELPEFAGLFYFFFPLAAVFFFAVAGVASAIFRQSSRVSDSGALLFEIL